MIVVPGYQTLDVISDNGVIRLYRLLRQEDGITVMAKTTCDEYPESTIIEAFLHEYEMVKNSQGLGTLEVYNLEIVGNRPILIMQNMEGITLDQLLRTRLDTVELADLLRIAVGVCECLVQIHRDNITLNEFIPSHVMVNPITYEVKLIDIQMGSTTLISSPLSLLDDRSEAMLPYISPEQTGRTGVIADYRSDFYSLGVILYEWLSGKLPFERHDNVGMVYHHLADIPKSLHDRNPSIPQAISDIVSKCMEKIPEIRYTSAFGIKSDLEECLHRLQESGYIDSFTLANEDTREHWAFPTQMYGRHSEQRILEGALQRAAGGAVETVWVNGDGGVGKTSFIKDTLQPAISPECFFATGEFNSYQKAPPYYIWIQIIGDLVDQLLMESKLQAEVWKLRILHASEGLGQLLIELCPKLELLIGAQPPVPSLPPVETQHRLHLIMNRFMQLFLHPNHPMVLFLDDLQWADDASLHYLAYLLEDRGTKSLLVALAYRERDMTTRHPLGKLEKQLADRDVSMCKISLHPLVHDDLRKLLIDALRCEHNEADELARVLLHKTEGNLFYLQQFFQDLIHDKKVTFDDVNRRWQWDIERISEMKVPETAVAYLSSKLLLLPQQTIYPLGCAAFLGSRFDLETLSVITKLHISHLSRWLSFAVDEHLLQPISDKGALLYQFQHDRIQHAAYKLVAPSERTDLHLRIGALLVERMELNDEASLFEAVDHLNQAREKIVCRVKKLELVKLNYQACLMAKQLTAYDTSLKYIEYAMQLLEEDSWEKEYTLTFRIVRERAELEYLCSYFDRAQTWFDLLMSQAATNLDKALVLTRKIELEASRDNYKEVIALGRQTMDLLNIHERLDDRFYKLVLQWLKVRRKLKRKPIESLIDLPVMTDESRRVAMTILVHVSNAAFYVDQKLSLAATLTMVEITIDYGMTPEAAIGFIGYAMFLYYQFNNYEETFKLGMLADHISRPYPNLHVRTLTAFALCFDSWRHYNPAILDSFTEQAGRVGLESGDLWQGNQSVLINCATLLQYGYPLGDIYDRLIANAGNFLQHNNNFHCKQATAFVALLVSLTGYRSKDDPFPIEEVDRDGFAESVHGDSFHVVQEQVCIYQYLPGYLFGHYHEANKALNKATAIIDTRVDKHNSIHHDMYESLVWAQLYEQSSKKQQDVYWQGMQRNLRKIKRASSRCPENYQHKYLWIKAEMARLAQKRRHAEELYEQSLEAARKFRHIHDLAMIAECYSKYGLQQGRLHLAKIYMSVAHEAYVKWGATKKVAELEKKHRYLLNISPSQATEHVDYLSVAKSAQVLSGEMDMHRLLDHLMRVMLHNAGGEYGAIILGHEGSWVVEAYGTVDDIHIDSVPLSEDSMIVPASIVAYAARTQETVVLHDAANEGMFVRNSYVRKNKLKSVLCLPIMNQHQLICLLYMENKLSPGIFTGERLGILKLLGSQCAISIANSKLYSDVQYLKGNLEDQVEERTRSLERAMRETSAALAEVSIYEERNRIAEEIHDIVGHTLTSTILQIEAGKRLIHKNMEGGVQRLNEAQDLVRHSLNEIRGSVHMLKEDKYAELSIMLNQLIRDTERNTGVTILASIHNLPELISSSYKKTIYHALQEGLTNGIRHGQSKEFYFSLETNETHIQFVLEDRGLGTTNIVMGFGLKAMKDRVEQLGGTISIESSANKGCLLRIDLPYQMR
ncbi:AAA family ATPase [Paenibacillus sp. CMAA1364]